MVFDEIIGRIHDALAVHGLSPSATLDLIRRRLNGVSSDQLLKAAIVALREQAEAAAQLENEIDTLAGEVDWLGGRETELEEDVEALETQRDKLNQELAALRDRLANTHTSAS
jgi:peptidoglycan hydrolase CwlO-like protein